MPKGLEHVWDWFRDLSRARLQGRPITYPDIDAYSRLMQIKMHPWEAALIRRLDMETLAAPARRAALEQQENAKPLRRERAR